jgi:multidrug resistance efflux pump
MTNDKQDPQAELARIDAEIAEAKAKAEQLAAKNEEKRKELLAKLREEDLALVRQKCELHGFTPTDLRGALKVRGGAKKKSTTTRKRATKK